MNTAMVTGVSSGIGRALAEVLVRRDWRVFGSLRSEAEAIQLERSLGAAFVPLLMDVTDEHSVAAAAAQVRERLAGRRLDALVNNAGVVLAGPLALQPTDEFRRQLEINLVGPFVVVKAFLPLLGSDPALEGKPGRIVNISSMAGKIGVPFMGAYAASKHGLEGFSDTLRCEVAQYGVRVVTVTPGSVATPVFSKAQPLAADYVGSDYEHSLSRFFRTMQSNVSAGHAPELVAHGIAAVLEAARPRVHYSIIWRKFMTWDLLRMMPRGYLSTLMCRQFGLSSHVPGVRRPPQPDARFGTIQD